MKVNEPAAKCPFCEGECGISDMVIGDVTDLNGENADLTGKTIVFHTVPPCIVFEKADSDTFVRMVRKAREGIN